MDNNSALINDTKEPTDIVLFGATGDLVTRKLLPSLFNLYKYEEVGPSLRIIAIGRQELSKEEYLNFTYQRSQKIGLKFTQEEWQNFFSIVEYLQIDVVQKDQYIKLKNSLRLEQINIYYLSTAPDLFKSICSHLASFSLNHARARIVLEKPLGNDLKSSSEINDFIADFFDEKQIFRIDHYLGKESVQNLLAIRFGNTLFEALWRRQWISSIQITIAENLGVESRGEFYDRTGALRDMLQNHLLQLLCIVAMEPPYSLEGDVVRDEKLKVLKSLKPLTEEYIINNVIRGQYKAGIINGNAVKGYVEEENISINSDTETYVALKAEVQNWRFAGVPFYLRTGKRLHEKAAEIVIQFKELPCQIFPQSANNFANRLIIKLQPEETIQLYFLAKKPGDTNELHPVYLDLDFAKMLPSRRMEAYERLLLDVIRGRLTLFVRRDEIDAAWEWVEPILNTWKKLNLAPKLYTAGSWGPALASHILARDNASWHEDLV